ncbi:three-Cys-motif partner protein TcmP [Nocardia aurantiaca]|uniref:Three-Cys-motif partner protein TcmP n=1 Tax=Nocardia aurantiaca TaxID=2675850 RepID=A0A6I3KWB5_9NOCA|nr:three-Cys-motif partner protein TcmP [Nocardia aurantiaca]MTE13897.1 three-Cys-motif partner protein TcmP [Nocardia aurantiaca]
MARQWSYWTSNKLQILGDYVDRFNLASKSSKERIYLDLMAGQPENIERHTGELIDGSPRRVLAAEHGFTRHVFFELPENAAKLEESLRKDFPDKKFRVVPGDCNETIDGVLAELMPFNRAPTFAFIDQQAAEVDWATIVKIAQFKSPQVKTKAELWLLVSPVFTLRGIRGTSSERFRERVTRFYGTDKWKIIQRALDANAITTNQYRDEMTNLIRFRLAEHLGYRHTHRIPMRMTNRTTIYDMVFATDHDAGDRIMRHLYKQAAEREPRMMAEARRFARAQKEEKSGQLSFFELPVAAVPTVTGDVLWQPKPHWWPSSRPWWAEFSDGAELRPEPVSERPTVAYHPTADRRARGPSPSASDRPTA